MAHFFSNFVATATNVGRGRIYVTSLNSPTKKTPCWPQMSLRCLVFNPNYGRFGLKFCCRSSGFFLASFNSPTPKTPCYTQRSRGYLLYKPSYSRYCPRFLLF